MELVETKPGVKAWGMPPTREGSLSAVTLGMAHRLTAKHQPRGSSRRLHAIEYLYSDLMMDISHAVGHTPCVDEGRPTRKRNAGLQTGTGR
jgi:hypothetical protein